LNFEKKQNKMMGDVEQTIANCDTFFVRTLRNNKPTCLITLTKSRRIRWAEHVARMGEMRNTFTILVGKPKGKRPLGRPRCRWEANIK
jgi:hypothetical protein